MTAAASQMFQNMRTTLVVLRISLNDGGIGILRILILKVIDSGFSGYVFILMKL